MLAQTQTSCSLSGDPILKSSKFCKHHKKIIDRMKHEAVKSGNEADFVVVLVDEAKTSQVVTQFELWGEFQCVQQGRMSS